MKQALVGFEKKCAHFPDLVQRAYNYEPEIRRHAEEDLDYHKKEKW